MSLSDFLSIKRETESLILTVQSDGDDLTDEDAKSFTDELLAERGDKERWTFDGIARLACDKVNVFYIC